RTIARPERGTRGREPPGKLASAGAGKQRDHSLRTNAKVDRKRAVPQIPQVVRKLLERALGVGGVAAGDLRPAGDSGLDQMAARPERDGRLEQLDELGALGARADDGHVAAEHVHELGQLVEPRAAEEAAERRDPRVSLLGPDG